MHSTTFFGMIDFMWFFVAMLLVLPTGVFAQPLPAVEQARQFVQRSGSAVRVVQRTPETPAEKEAPFDEGLFEDTLEPGKGPAQPPSGEGKEGAVGPRRLTIDAVVTVDYLFFHSPDRFKVKYHLNLGGDVPQDVTVLKGQAKVATDVSGYLAKWEEGECVLKVTIAEVPYEIAFKKNAENEADVEVKFPQPIMEDWESLCTFLDDPNAKLNTRGTPEKWIAVALEKASPPLSRLAAPLSADEATTVRFTIAKHTVQDENIGSAELEGNGVITIQPGKTPEEKAAETAGK